VLERAAVRQQIDLAVKELMLYVGDGSIAA
jgi:hypothetical protein